jgi:hypothetical protein
MVLIDMWFFYSTINNTAHEGLALFFAFITHFGVAIYYYQKHEKRGSLDRPYQAYAFLGFFLPWFAVALCENLRGKAQKVVENGIVVMYFVIGIGVFILSFIYW